MKVSIISPTYNGAKKVLNLLKALETQTFSDFEVVIVVDGSTDETLSVLENFKKNSLLNLKVVAQSNNGRSIARNKGVQKAQGELLIFFDDDMQPLKNCIEDHIKHHSVYLNSISVGTQEEFEVNGQTDFQRFKGYIVKKWINALPLNGIPINKKNTYITAANFSIAKTVFEEIGGFDERLTDAEDFELGTRAIEKGINIYYNPSARAFHKDPVTCCSYIRRQREYAKAHKKLHQIKPEIVGKFNNAQVYNPSYLKKALFSLFANKFFVYSIDQFNFYQFILPQKLRYKLYDLVVWGLAKVYPDRKI